jgi:hypothetical protein
MQRIMCVNRNLPSNRELAVYALYSLGASERFNTETIAVRCHELFPTAFSWATRPDLPDKDIVRVALTDARKEKHGALVEGRSGQSSGHYEKTRRGPMTDGWQLTNAGLEWTQENAESFEALLEKPIAKDHRQKSRRMLRRVREHELFQQFVAESTEFSPGIGQLADLARCRVDAEPSVWRARFEKFRRLALETDQQDIEAFIAACLTAYENVKE